MLHRVAAWSSLTRDLAGRSPCLCRLKVDDTPESRRRALEVEFDSLGNECRFVAVPRLETLIVAVMRHSVEPMRSFVDLKLVARKDREVEGLPLARCVYSGSEP